MIESDAGSVACVVRQTATSGLSGQGNDRSDAVRRESAVVCGSCLSSSDSVIGEKLIARHRSRHISRSL